MEEDEGRGCCYAERESTLAHILCGGNLITCPPHCLLVSFNGGGLVWFPTAHVEGAPRKLFLPSSLVVPPGRTRCWSYFGRRARPFLGRALRAQGTSTGAFPPPLTFPSFPIAHQIHARRLCNGCNPIQP